jgi:hypothetical protein
MHRKLILALLLIGYAPATQACGLFEACKKPAPVRAIKASRANQELLDIKARVAKLEEGERAYVKTLSILHQHIANLQLQINALKPAAGPAKK